MNCMLRIATVLLASTASLVFAESMSAPAAAASPRDGEMLPGRFPAFHTRPPATLQEWEQQRINLRRKLWRLLGDIPPAFVPKPTLLGRQERPGCTIEKLSFDNGAGDTVYAYLVIPAGGSNRYPALLYHHMHTSNERLGKEELVQPWRETPDGRSPAETLAGAGYVVLCIDAYTFGDRRGDGPGGKAENGNQTEESLFKMFLWQGRTLFGMMLRDDLLALNLLAARPEVDPQRIGAMGFSMGATRTWWLAALDDRIHAAVSVSCLTRYQDLITVAGLKCQSIFYFVPGLLKEGIDMEQVVGLIAPRPLLTLTGDLDEGSPVQGVRTINQFQEKLYDLYGKPGNFRGVIYPNTKHSFTAEMWKETLTWFAAKLAPPAEKR